MRMRGRGLWLAMVAAGVTTLGAAPAAASYSVEFTVGLPAGGTTGVPFQYMLAGFSTGGIHGDLVAITIDQTAMMTARQYFWSETSSADLRQTLSGAVASTLAGTSPTGVAFGPDVVSERTIAGPSSISSVWAGSGSVTLTDVATVARYLSGQAVSIGAVGPSIVTEVITGRAFEYQSRALSGYSTIRVNYITTLLPGGVPEPETWATMVAGFGLIGAMARRRRPARDVLI